MLTFARNALRAIVASSQIIINFCVSINTIRIHFDIYACVTPISYYGDKKMIKRKSMLPLMRVVTALMLLVVPTAIGRVATASAATDGSDNVRLSGFEVSAVTDGTAPFDDDDSDGNDSVASNGRVRSFDSVMYTMSYTTELIDNFTLVDEADIDVEIELQMSPKEALFNMSSLNWLENAEVLYWREDGTSSDMWTADDATEFVRQTVTGTRHIVNGNGGNAIPGTGTLVVGIDVMSAPNGCEIKPSMSIWMQGRESERLTADFDPVIVSAKPSLNLRMQAIGNNVDRYFDISSYRQYMLDDDAKNLIAGRMYKIGFAVEMKNTDEHGMRGYELPTGDITLDFDISVKRDGVDVTDDPRFAPVFWDYSNNNMYVYRGMLGHMIGFSVTSAGDSADGLYRNSTPNMSLDGHTLHVRLSGYGFDYKRWSPYKGSMNLDESTYVFAMANVFFVMPLDAVSEEGETLIEATIRNIAFDGEAHSDVRDEWTLDDNKKSAVIDAFRHVEDDVVEPGDGYPSSDTNLYSKTVGTDLADWGTYDSRAYVGEEFKTRYWFIKEGSHVVTDCDMFIKLDTSVMDLSDMTFEVNTAYDGRDPAEEFDSNNITTLYAAKPDGQHWSSDEEMDLTHEENLIYFDSYDACKSAGYECVGLLFEVRDARVQAPYPGIVVALNHLKVKDGTAPGTLTQTTSEWRVWELCDDVPSWTEYQYAGVNGAYGIGDASLNGGDVSLRDVTGYDGLFADGYLAPTSVLYTRFDKIQYDAFGNITKNANGRYSSNLEKYVGGLVAGANIYVISGRATIDVKVSNAADGEPKNVFDLDQGERTAWYTIAPALVLNSDVQMRSDVRIEVTLPKGVHYIDGTLSAEPATVTNFADGSGDIEKMTFEMKNALIGEELPKITFAVTIGDAGTDSDLDTGTSLSCSASIKAGFCQKYTKGEDELDYATFSVIRLSTSSIMKSVRDVIMPHLSDNSFTLRFGNTSDTVMDDVTLYDVMPYDGDLNGSAFSGGYRVVGFDIDMTHAQTLAARIGDAPSFEYSTSDGARVTASADVEDRVSDETLGWAPVGNWSASGGHAITTGLDITDMSAFRFNIGDMPSNEYIDVTMLVDFADSDESAIPDADGGEQQPNDVYANSFYEWSPNQPSVVRSNVVLTTVEYISIALDKSATERIDDAVAGESKIEYEFVITNNGDHPLHGVSLTDDMLDGVSEVTIDWAGSTDPSTGEGALSPSESVTAMATYVVTQADIDRGSVENTATATGENESGTDEVEDTDTVTTTLTGSASISLTKDVDKEAVDLGADDGRDEYRTLTYSFIIENTGSLTLTDVTLDDAMLAASGTVVSIDWDASTDVAIPAGTLAPGETVRGTAQYRIAQPDIDAGKVTNTATVTGTPSDGSDDVTSTDDAETTILNPNPGIALEKLASVGSGASVAVGTEMQWLFRVTNTGNVTLTNVTIDDHMVESVDYGDWDRVLEPTESETVLADYVVRAEDISADGTIVNTATATGTPPSGGSTNVEDDSTTEVSVDTNPSLTMTKSVDKGELIDDAAVPGAVLEYSFTVENTGDVTLTDVSIDDMLDGVRDLSIDWDASSDAGTVAGALSPGETVPATASYDVTQADIDAGIVTNRAVAHGTDGGDAVTSNEATATTIIRAPEPDPTPEPEPTPTDPTTPEQPPADDEANQNVTPVDPPASETPSDGAKPSEDESWRPTEQIDDNENVVANGVVSSGGNGGSVADGEGDERGADEMVSTGADGALPIAIAFAACVITVASIVTRKLRI